MAFNLYQKPNFLQKFKKLAQKELHNKPPDIIRINWGSYCND